MEQYHNLMRSLLFVPGNRPERFAKASRSGADIYCIDLEDSVPAAEKDSARWAAVEHINHSRADSHLAPSVALRINSLATLAGVKDLVALAEQLSPESVLDYVMLPMTENAAQIRQVVGVMSDAPSINLIPLIETPQGIDNLNGILDASEQIQAVAFGLADFTAITGSELGWEPLLYARSRIAEISNARGVPCLDGPWFDIADTGGLEDELRKLVPLGFGGKLAIHPSQIETINQCFVPSLAKVQWARKIIARWEQVGGGAVSVDGYMIDQPLVRRAKRVLTLANIQIIEENDASATPST